MTALTWALEIGDPARFSSIADIISYSGLCAAEDESRKMAAWLLAIDKRKEGFAAQMC